MACLPPDTQLTGILVLSLEPHGLKTTIIYTKEVQGSGANATQWFAGIPGLDDSTK